ncbi:copper amine oxidase [Schizophyllum amplum]|uniref:Amine oxidase n=1 Tax=Schizophyllum amplum TaxID=97359 RepID=A0A550CN92_9AGAR|nr:copper amine oxidase [Auriculariopsis ampla]
MSAPRTRNCYWSLNLCGELDSRTEASVGSFDARRGIYAAPNPEMQIAAVCLVVRHHTTSIPDITALKFITCGLIPPPKRAVLAHLGIPLTPGGKPEPATPIIRQAEVDFVELVKGQSYNTVLSLADGAWNVDTLDLLPEGSQPQISVEELVAAEKTIKADKRIQELAKAVGVEPEQIVCDGWSIGYDDRFPQQRRVQQALIFARFGEHENLYAHPMDFIAVLDSNAETVLQIDFPPTRKSTPNGPALSVSTTAPGALGAEFAAANRDRIPPPKKPFDFLPDLMAKSDPDYKPREGLKPLHVVQPEGVIVHQGATIYADAGDLAAFTHREGIALSTITYNDNGEIRPLFYRLSLAEMVVPYGAPEFPHSRKFAFDSGEYGMGTMANELSLGCDCLGQIHYLPGSYVANDGSVITIKNVICIHEEDNGVLWKHTDYRPGGRSQTVRRRRLVISMVCTLANYEYIWNYHFYQDGSIELETRLTGILQVYVGADGEPNPHGTYVAPNVNAHYHQHMFSLRIDPMIDGLQNSVMETDVMRMPDAPTGSVQNFAGNAFMTKDSLIKQEGSRQYDLSTDRRWRIVNSARKHYSSGANVGYSIGVKGGMVPSFVREDSWCARRSGFIKAPLWVVRDVEGPKGSRMWPSGKYVPQSRTTPEDSLEKWSTGGGKVEDEDILVYVTFGTTHIPRPEDWPVMPVEHLNITLKPQSFFTKNPSMDVQGSKDTHSVAAFTNGDAAGTVIMSDAFDLEALVHVEQDFYDSGYKDGHDHGRIHGLIEGRALGREKGFEMWEELGFYQGFAMMWQSIYTLQGRTDECVVSVKGAAPVTELLRQPRDAPHQAPLEPHCAVPRVNPSSADASSELDIPKLFRQIRSRYKALCATLGVRPSLRASTDGEAAEGDASPTGDMEKSPGKSSGGPVWSVGDGTAGRSRSSSAGVEISF